MSSELSMLQEFVKMFFPHEIAENFLITGIESTPESVLIHLEEKDVLHHPEAGHEYEKNGFYPASEIRDFPLRERRVTLSVKRRRWIDRTTGRSVSNRYDLVAEGTRHSKEFASFLKGALGQIPDNGPLS